MPQQRSPQQRFQNVPPQPARAHGAPRRPAPAPAAMTALHLTWRGQVVLVLALLGLLLAAFSLRQVHSDAATTAAATTTSALLVQQTALVQQAQATVHRGDTLWSVARRIAPNRDARELVAELRALNRLSGGTLRVGQQLLIPALG